MIINKLTGLGVVKASTDRQTGRSTGLALKYISEALRRPSMEVYIVDRAAESYEVNCLLFSLTQKLVEKLELNFMVLNWHKLSLTYELYGEEEAPSRVLCDGRLFGRIDCKPHTKIFDGKEYEPL